MQFATFKSVPVAFISLAILIDLKLDSWIIIDFDSWSVGGIISLGVDTEHTFVISLHPESVVTSLWYLEPPKESLRMILVEGVVGSQVWLNA